MSESVYRSVTRVCQAGLDSVTLRREIAARIAGAVTIDAHVFGTIDPDTGILNHLVAADVPPALAVEYAALLYPTATATHLMDAARAGRIVVRAGEESPEILDSQRRSGFAYGTHVLLADHARLWGTWCLLRGDAPPDDVRREQSLLRRLVPHITRGLQQAVLIDAALGARELDGTTPGMLLLDSRGRPVFRAGAIAAMLEDLADVGVEYADAIPAAIRTAALRLHRARRSGESGGGATLRAHGRSGRWYTIEACIAEPTADGESATAVIVRPMVPRERAAMLTDLYGLSRREREVTAAVARGETTKEIAARLGVSPHTIKEHVDRACAKIGVQGRKALVARLYFDVYQPGSMDARPGVGRNT